MVHEVMERLDEAQSKADSGRDGVDFVVDGVDCVIAPSPAGQGDWPYSESKGFIHLCGFKLGGKSYRIVARCPDLAMDRMAAVALDIGVTERLTQRELEVALLVAQGKLNKQIASELSLSVYTVSTHLRRIFAKLGVHNRTALAARLAPASGV